MACGCDIKMKFTWSAIVVLVCLWQVTDAGKKQKERSQSKPNIIFILTDDQDLELGSMWVMNKTRSIFSKGADFVNAFVTSPICCPSRSSILTGMYAHNHNTLTNNVNCSSPNWRAGPERRTYGKYLADAGYLTGHFGKYLNEYDGSYIPAGWHRWIGLVRNSRFYNYTLRHNTFSRKHKNIYKKDYFTDVITNHSLAFFRHAKARNPGRPVLMVISHAAPHGPEDSAPQYQATLENITSPRLPNWNFMSPDKHWIVRVTPEMTDQKIAFSDLLHRKRLQTLMSVDDSVQRVYNMLKDTGTLNNTYLFFSSDHGYHLGQYGLVKGKSMPYESDIRVPLYVRGPKIPQNVKMHQVVLNIDLAPTFLDIAGVKVPRQMDGASVMKFFRRLRSKNQQPRVRRKTSHMWRDTFLIERGKPRRWNKPKAPKKHSKKSEKVISRERLCTDPKFKSPCSSSQQWHCVRINGQQRLRKCKKTLTDETLPLTPTTVWPDMCTCYRPRIPRANRANEEPHSDDSSLYVNRVLRRHKRSSGLRSSLRSSSKRKRLLKELARAIKQQTRRNKAKLIAREIKKSKEEITEPTANLDDKLLRLNARIAGIRVRLETLRDRKKKLIRIKEEKESELTFKQKYEEFPCLCPTPSKSTIKKTKRPRRSHRRGRLLDRLRSGKIQPDVYRRKKNRRNMRKSGLRSGLRKAFYSKRKKKSAKKSTRRSKCSIPGLNCFYQTNVHWKTPPLWKGGEFCFCPSSSNNTYWCLRTLNQHQNFLYCEFITEFLEYFDLNTDPYQLYNIVDRINTSVLYELHNQLEHLKGCKGAQSCTQYHGKPRPTLTPTTQSPNILEETTGGPVVPVTEKTLVTTEVKTEETPTVMPTVEIVLPGLKNETKKSEVEEKGDGKDLRKKKGVETKGEKKRKKKKKSKVGKESEKNLNKNFPSQSPLSTSPTSKIPKRKNENGKKNGGKKKRRPTNVKKTLGKKDKSRVRNKAKRKNGITNGSYIDKERTETKNKTLLSTETPVTLSRVN